MTQMSDTIEDKESSDDNKANSISAQCSSDQYYDKDCTECHIIRRDPTPSELTMCLHALSYKVTAVFL